MKIEKYENAIDAQVYKPKAPFLATVLGSEKLTAESRTDEIFHVKLDIRGSNLQYIEGQSLGVLAPGKTLQNKNHKLRLYSIASASKGDDGDSNTVSICVKRVVYQDEVDSTVKGIASNYICDWKLGDQVLVTGPVGKSFVLPRDPTCNLLLIATGTGIAPMRSFLRHIYDEHKSWQGQIKLFYGVKTAAELLYANQSKDEITDFETNSNFEFYSARSREQLQPDGSKLYVQDLLQKESLNIWKMLNSNTCIYICGLKGMEKGIHSVIEEIALTHNQKWADLVTTFRSQGRWNVEVY